MALRRSGKRQKVDAERAADSGAARSVAASILRTRDHGTGELESKLRERGFESAAASAVVGELGGLGLLDDRRYAESFVRLHAERGHGPLRIAADLRARKLPAEVIQAALATVSSWAAVAQAARIRRFGRPVPGTRAEKARQARFLQYRGFSSDHIGSALGPDLHPDIDLES